ncbi:MAG: universal stress protein [Chloroflexi bacterium]|nr:universal stress protein [Chloroflexota bacterium]
MFRTILVPVDGSELAESALAYAARIAAPVDGNVILLRAEALTVRRRPRIVSADPLSMTWLVPADPQARMTLEAAAARVQADGVAAEVDFKRYRRGGAMAAAAILDAVREQQPDLIVMSTRSRSGLARWRYGSVADQIVRGADVPVLLVPPTVKRPWPFERALRILVPLDGSALAEEILTPAGQMADQLGAQLHLLRAVEPHPVGVRANAPHAAGSLRAGGLVRARAYLAHIVDRVRRVDMAVTMRAVVGRPETTIADAAREADVDLIAMATHGRGGLKRLLLGSVTNATLQKAGVPLLLVRPDPAGRKAAGVGGSVRAPVESIAPVTVTVSDWSRDSRRRRPTA